MRTEQEAKELYNENINLVKATVERNFSNPAFWDAHGISKEELIQSGKIGLYRACKTYDSSRGVLFRTYAINYIKWTIKDEFKRDSLGKSEKWGLQLANRVSMDQDLSFSSEDVATLHDFVGDVDEGYNEVEVSMQVEEKLNLLSQVLPKRVSEIVKLKYEGHSMVAIAKMLDVTHQYVSSVLRKHKDEIVALVKY